MHPPEGYYTALRPLTGAAKYAWEPGVGGGRTSTLTQRSTVTVPKTASTVAHVKVRLIAER